MNKSPSINLKEQDLSAYTPQSFDKTTLAVVGFATKGPFDIATLVSSRNEFLEEFGTPPTDYPYSHLSVYRAFNQGSKVLFKRIGDTGGDTISATTSQRVIDFAPGDTLKFVLLETYEKGSDTNKTSVVVSF